MKKLLIAAAVVAIAAVPGVAGLVSNASFAQSVPVHVPAGAKSIHDDARHSEPGGDHVRHAEPGDDRSNRFDRREDRVRHVEPADDRGGASRSGHDARDGSADR